MNKAQIKEYTISLLQLHSKFLKENNCTVIMPEERSHRYSRMVEKLYAEVMKEIKKETLNKAMKKAKKNIKKDINNNKKQCKSKKS